MNSLVIKDKNYSKWLGELKQKDRLVQIKAAVKVNSELLSFYWDLGEDIFEKQKNTKWVKNFLKQLGLDLSKKFPDKKGFFIRNPEHIQNWHLFWVEHSSIAKQLATKLTSLNAGNDSPNLKIPWWHNVVIITKIKNADEAYFKF